MTGDLPEDVKDFIGKHIHTYAQLEVLLMLRKEPDRAWTLEQLTSGLYLQSQMVARLLTDIVQRGFAVQEQDCFRYQAGNDVDRQLIDRLAHMYQERRMAVITEIFSKPIDFAKAFADAFRLRNEE